MLLVYTEINESIMSRVMTRLFLKFIALMFPWLILLMHDNPGGALVALIMQVTLIGWLPATMWALQVLRDAEKSKNS